MHIFLKEQKYLKDHAAKIHLIFKSPNENKQNQAFPNQKFHFLDAFPNQKELCFDAYPNQNPYLGYYYYSKKGGCTTEYHNTPTAYIKFILQ